MPSWSHKPVLVHWGSISACMIYGFMDRGELHTANYTHGARPGRRGAMQLPGVICCWWAELDRKGLDMERLPEQGCKATDPTASNGLQKCVGSRRPVCTCNSGLRPGCALQFGCIWDHLGLLLAYIMSLDSLSEFKGKDPSPLPYGYYPQMPPLGRLRK